MNIDQIVEPILWGLLVGTLFQALLVALALALSWCWHRPRAGRREGEPLDGYVARLEQKNAALKELLGDAITDLEEQAKWSYLVSPSSHRAATHLAARLRTALKRLEER